MTKTSLEDKLIINCTENNNTDYIGKVNHACNDLVEVNEINIYCRETVGYDSESIIEYYTICPHCGYIIHIDESLLPENLKLIAINKNKEDIYLNKKNELISELIYLNSITSNAKVRVRTYF